MEFHCGRLFDHVELRVKNLETSKRFYKAVFASLGLAHALVEDEEKNYFHYDELYVLEADADAAVSHIHIGLQAANREMVNAFYTAAMAAGGRDNGAPGERAYHPGYYAAFVLDPDGNNIEAVYHGPFTRSAESVIVKPA